MFTNNRWTQFLYPFLLAAFSFFLAALSFFLAALRAFLPTLSLLSGSLPSQAALAQQAAAAAPTSVYLPMVMNSGTPQPLPVPVGAFFVEPDTKTGNAAIATDLQGGLHLGYSYYLPDADHPAAVYLYCPPTSDCSDPAQWNGVAMGDLVNEVQLALTSAGQPRLLFRATSQVYANGNDYFYAACDQNCTDPGQWSIVYLLSNSAAIFEINDRTTPQRSFALDPQGRPRFVYQDYNYSIEPDHIGAFYVYCDVDCADPAAAQWYEARISAEINDPYNYRYEVFYYPSLTFTSQGQPRLVADVSTIDDAQKGIYYLACDAGCDDEANWGRVRLFERGFGTKPSWDLELDGSNRPRIAFYEGDQLGDAGDILHYAWCNGSCLTGAGWQHFDLGLGALNGQHPDLQLDTQGRPRIAMITQGGGGLGYAWCDGACDNQASWQSTTLENATTLAQAYPVPLPSHCQTGLWDSFAPVLALDPAGRPRIAYDSKYEAYCLYDDPTDNLPPYYRFEQVWHSVRVFLTDQP